MVNTNVSLGAFALDNPVIPASGTFAFGHEFADIYDINCLGSISLKGTTAQPRFGNPTPRIAETPSGMINSVGLQNPGVDAVISEEIPKLAACFHKKASPISPAFRSKNTSSAPKSSTPATRSGCLRSTSAARTSTAAE